MTSYRVTKSGGGLTAGEYILDAGAASSTFAKFKIDHLTTKDRWFNISEKHDGRTATVDIFDEIGIWGTPAKEFSSQLNALDVDTIYLNVNSPGGDVFDGIAILNTLRAHPAQVVATVKGLAASAASFLLMGADEVVMARNSELMIHNASGMVFGDADDMTAMAANLSRCNANIASIYAEKAGGEPKEWLKAMKAETWYSADDAVTAGLADRVDAKADATEAKNAFLPRFTNRAAAPAPYLPSTHMPPAEQLAEHPSPTEGVADMPSDTLVTGLRARLGISADADLDEDGILAALDEVLDEQSDDTPAESVVPEGAVLVDEAEYASLRADAALGRQAHEHQVAEARLAFVNKAVSEGRIPPARREFWLAQLTADPGASAVIDSFPKGSIALTEIGYTGGVDEASDDDTLYNSLFTKEA
jgi:ATP-dependent Clp endopeptidase proteolytic subunit ClpP